jgi:Co/Zn/Cd efflux system component
VICSTIIGTAQLQALLTATSGQGKGSGSIASNFANMHAIFLHAAADSLLHAGLLFANWLSTTQDIVLASGIVFLVIAFSIIRYVWPLASQMGLILLQTTPPVLSVYLLFLLIHPFIDVIDLSKLHSLSIYLIIHL